MESGEREENMTAHVELGVLEYGHDDSQMRTHYRGQMLGKMNHTMAPLYTTTPTHKQTAMVPCCSATRVNMQSVPPAQGWRVNHP